MRRSCRECDIRRWLCLLSGRNSLYPTIKTLRALTAQNNERWNVNWITWLHRVLTAHGNEMKIFLVPSRGFRIITSVVSFSRYFRASSISLRTLQICLSYISLSRSYRCCHCSIRFPINCKFKANIFVILAKRGKGVCLASEIPRARALQWNFKQIAQRSARTRREFLSQQTRWRSQYIAIMYHICVYIYSVIIVSLKFSKISLYTTLY